MGEEQPAAPLPGMAPQIAAFKRWKSESWLPRTMLPAAKEQGRKMVAGQTRAETRGSRSGVLICQRFPGRPLAHQSSLCLNPSFV